MKVSSHFSSFTKWWIPNSPVPYMFGSLTILFLVIMVALIVLMCYKRFEGSSASNEAKQSNSIYASVELVKDLKIVVIMAGDEQPTRLATPSPSPV
ncbi:hypothetical protein Leryth_024452 [Lithospermum erythrorhizon]|nr:hypothetical protein Leryth_024452 [Lithospermum erythrorhizon]